MFFLSEIEHTLRLPPHLLNLPQKDAIKGELDSLFLDKVIEQLGLCVSVYDILSTDGGFIFPSDGASTYTVRFRLVMFRPFVGEVISARLKESTKDGLRLSLGFFEDIYVPVPLLNTPNHFEPNPDNRDGVMWVWEYEGQNYPIDRDDEIRFKVHNVSYPPLPLGEVEVLDGEESHQKVSKPFAPMVVTIRFKVHNVSYPPLPLGEVEVLDGEESHQKVSKPFAPMVVTGAIDAEGLGPISWWV